MPLIGPGDGDRAGRRPRSRRVQPGHAQLGRQRRRGRRTPGRSRRRGRAARPPRGARSTSLGCESAQPRHVVEVGADLAAVDDRDRRAVEAAPRARLAAPSTLARSLTDRLGLGRSGSSSTRIELEARDQRDDAVRSDPRVSEDASACARPGSADVDEQRRLAEWRGSPAQRGDAHAGVLQPAAHRGGDLDRTRRVAVAADALGADVSVRSVGGLRGRPRWRSLPPGRRRWPDR